jgi:hypothetical protein
MYVTVLELQGVERCLTLAEIELVYVTVGGCGAFNLKLFRRFGFLGFRR